MLSGSAVVTFAVEVYMLSTYGTYIWWCRVDSIQVSIVDELGGFDEAKNKFIYAKSSYETPPFARRTAL
jgi:hypothetical protein